MSGARRLLPLACIAAVVVLGGAIRLVDLGTEPLHEEELNHVVVAGALEAGGPPSLPSGALYTRALDYSRMVRFSSRHIAHTPTAARLPSAAFGVLGLLLVAAVAWSVAGPWAAVWATLLLAIFPEAVAESRRARFYTYQTSWSIVALLAAWRVVEDAGARTGARGRRWLWAGVLALAFAAAFRVQLNTLTLVAGFGVIACVAAAADLRAGGREAWRRSVPLQLVVLGVLGGVALLAARPGLLPLLADVALCRGPACDDVSRDPGLYYRGLAASFPLLVGLAPLLLLGAAVRRPRLTLFLSLWFAVPFLLYSFAFPRQAVRFLLGAAPALFILVGVAAATGAGALRRTLRDRLPAARGDEGSGPSPRTRELLAAAGVGLVAFVAVATSPGLAESLRLPSAHPRLDWEAAGRIVEGVEGGARIPLGSTYAMPPLHYWGRFEFSVATDYRARAFGGPPAEGIVARAEGGTLLEPYAGRPILALPDDIRTAYPGADTVLIVVDEGRWEEGNVEEELKRTLVEEAEELCRGRCPGLRVYLWQPSRSRAPPP